MKKIPVIVISVLFMFSCTESQSFRLPVEVKLQSGLITGVPGRYPAIMVFKGIPYAEPPVGNLRWQPPQPVESWKGIRACSKFGPNAMQAPQAPFMMWSEEFIIDTSLGTAKTALPLMCGLMQNHPMGKDLFYSSFTEGPIPAVDHPVKYMMEKDLQKKVSL